MLVPVHRVSLRDRRTFRELLPDGFEQVDVDEWFMLSIIDLAMAFQGATPFKTTFESPCPLDNACREPKPRSSLLCPKRPG